MQNAGNARKMRNYDQKVGCPKMNKSVATVATDIIVRHVEIFETMKVVEQNDVVKVADPDFEICCTAIDLAEVVESKHEIHGKACVCDDLVKVVESEYEIHGKACDNVVEVVESHDEVHSKASEVNELRDVKDVDGAEAKQGRVLEVVALAPVDTK